MQYTFIREKAVMMCYLVISLAFFISLAHAAYAQEEAPAESAETPMACCERTTSGDTCIYTEASECDTGYKSANFQKCEDASFCRPECCVDPVGGACSKQTAQATCRDAGFEWSPVAD